MPEFDPRTREGCAGFTSDGWRKSVIKPQLDPFPGYAWPCEGLFVRKGALRPLAALAGLTRNLSEPLAAAWAFHCAVA